MSRTVGLLLVIQPEGLTFDPEHVELLEARPEDPNASVPTLPLVAILFSARSSRIGRQHGAYIPCETYDEAVELRDEIAARIDELSAMRGDHTEVETR